MKIVHVEDAFFPNTGYQLPLLAKYMSLKGHDVTIVSSEMEKIPNTLKGFFLNEDVGTIDNEYTKETGVKIIRLPLISYISGRAIFSNQLLKTVKLISPEIIFVHGNDTLTGIIFLMNAKKIEAPIVMDSHMLEMASVNNLNKVFRRFYKMFITPIILKRNICVIRTQNDDYIEKHLGIPLDNSPWISTGSDVFKFKPCNETKLEFRLENKISADDFVIIYAGKLDKHKGGKFLAEALVEEFYGLRRNIVFIVVGNVDGDYGEEIEQIFSESKNRILRFPTQSYKNLPKYYQASDLAVFPKQCSLSFYDVQSSGLPVLLEDNGINIQRLQHGNGVIFKEDNVEDFRKKIHEMVNISDEDFIKMSKNAREYVLEHFNYESITDKYINILEREIDTWRE